MVGPKMLNWFVSHYWGMTFCHLVEALRRHEAHFAQDGQNMAYWVCAFSNNQHCIEEELGDGQICESSFYQALRHRNCEGTVMVLDESAQPLQRAWCLFEVFQTFQICQERRLQVEEQGSYHGLVMSCSSGVLSRGGGGADVCMSLALKLATLDLRSASATDERDLRMIHALVAATHGGFDSINAFVRVSIRDALLIYLIVYQRYQQDFGQLVETLVF
mmetsp:Transcript_52884/g.99086  ORF Transcript_52884/g.99086 Transcript_52884/m.99086 type:complete len:218 (+) Transcript_52884:799-1452(+)